MGMAASQVRLLQLTSRKNTIGRTLEDLSLQKTSLSRDMKRVSKQYQDALSTKTLKWSNNSGITYVDLSYSNLMRPNTYNNNTPYLLTNEGGQVVVDSKYEEYADMLSANGGKYEGDTRLEILSGLTGLSKEKLSNAVSTSEAVNSSAETVNNLQAELDKIEAKEPVSNKNLSDFLALAGDITIGTSSYNLSKLKTQNGTVTLGNSDAASSNLNALLDNLTNNLSRYLSDDDAKAFKEACNTFKDYTSLFNSSSDALKNSGSAFTKDGDNYKVNVATMMGEIMSSYCRAGGSSKTSNTTGSTLYPTRDTQSDTWKNWKAEYDAKAKELSDAQATYKGNVNIDNQSLTATQESEIKFYDQLFTAMATNGYEVNSSVEDNNYLNQMLQNNQYFITTMKAGDEDEDGNTIYEYDSCTASNFDNIFSVNDSSVQQEAQVQYEYEKSVISEKESRIDQRMQNLETEQSAINEMIKGIESVKDKNIETNFSIFS